MKVTGPIVPETVPVLRIYLPAYHNSFLFNRWRRIYYTFLYADASWVSPCTRRFATIRTWTTPRSSFPFFTFAFQVFFFSTLPRTHACVDVVVSPRLRFAVGKKDYVRFRSSWHSFAVIFAYDDIFSVRNLDHLMCLRLPSRAFITFIVWDLKLKPMCIYYNARNLFNTYCM